jgi:hypothetical protein
VKRAWLEVRNMNNGLIGYLEHLVLEEREEDLVVKKIFSKNIRIYAKDQMLRSLPPGFYRAPYDDTARPMKVLKR